MIFDNALAENLLREYSILNDSNVLDALHSEAESLIEVLASSINYCPREDLIQVGHLKMQELVENDMFDPKRGSMHSFLTVSLRRAMLDYTKWFQLGAPSEYCEGEDGAEYMSEIMSFCDIPPFEASRFSSLDRYVVSEASWYIIEAVCEQAREGYRGILRTLITVYPIKRDLGTSLFHSISAVMRMEVSGVQWRDNIEDALGLAVIHGEKSLIPEVCLLFGKEMSTAISVAFRGAYVKF